MKLPKHLLVSFKVFFIIHHPLDLIFRLFGVSIEYNCVAFVIIMAFFLDIMIAAFFNHIEYVINFLFINNLFRYRLHVGSKLIPKDVATKIALYSTIQNKQLID
jgi:hypothetical protein